MKGLVIVVALLIVCIVLFLVGLFSPRRSRRLQGAVDDISRKGEGKSDERAGRLGDVTRDALEKARGAADASARAGRRVNKRVRGT
jgi:hypothetical protein